MIGDCSARCLQELVSDTNLKHQQITVDLLSIYISVKTLICEAWVLAGRRHNRSYPSTTLTIMKIAAKAQLEEFGYFTPIIIVYGI
jgi:hypothetical protein